MRHSEQRLCPAHRHSAVPQVRERSHTLRDPPLLQVWAKTPGFNETPFLENLWGAIEEVSGVRPLRTAQFSLPGTAERSTAAGHFSAQRHS